MYGLESNYFVDKKHFDSITGLEIFSYLDSGLIELESPRPLRRGFLKYHFYTGETSYEPSLWKSHHLSFYKHFHLQNSVFVYYYFTKNEKTNGYWSRMIYDFSFEQAPRLYPLATQLDVVFDEISKETKEKLLFNLDLFL